MQRVFGAMAVFIGWLSLGIGVMGGLIESQFFGLNHKEDALPPMDVYGITGAVVLWIFVGAALLLAVPMATAMVAPDPRSSLRRLAVAMGIGGIVLLPDLLGRFFGLPVVAGAVCVWIGGELIHRDALEAESIAKYPRAPGMSISAEPASAAEAPARAEAPAATGPQTTAAVKVAAPGQAATPVPTPQAADGRSRRSSRRKTVAAERLCPWCSTAVPADATSCPNCQAILDTQAGDSIEIAGVTQVSPALQDYAEKVRAGKGRTSLLSMIFSDPPIAPATNAPAPSDADALRPPSAALKAEMARLDADIAAGAGNLAPRHETDGSAAGVDHPAAPPAESVTTAPAEPSDATDPRKD